MKQKNDQKKQPFFVKLLEAQRPQEERNHEGKVIITKPIWDINETLKYPSDGDEI